MTAAPSKSIVYPEPVSLQNGASSFCGKCEMLTSSEKSRLINENDRQAMSSKSTACLNKMKRLCVKMALDHVLLRCSIKFHFFFDWFGSSEVNLVNSSVSKFKSKRAYLDFSTFVPCVNLVLRLYFISVGKVMALRCLKII
jgi:hypothetical protein